MLSYEPLHELHVISNLSDLRTHNSYMMLCKNLHEVPMMKMCEDMCDLGGKEMIPMLEKILNHLSIHGGRH